MSTAVAVRDYVLFASSLPASVHASTLEHLIAEQMGQHTPHEHVPISIVFDPAVSGAVSELLGEHWRADVCRHVHLNNHPEDGPWHRDNYDEGPWPKGVTFAVLYYFPQDTPLRMGPTAILVDGQEIIGVGPAGTCLLVRGGRHMHRARANVSGQQRYMLKYLFRSARSG